MDRLQHLLDTAFGQPAAPHAPQKPNEFTIQRQRAFEEMARKVEELRRARLAQSDVG
jgi:hypothetical protein